MGKNVLQLLLPPEMSQQSPAPSCCIHEFLQTGASVRLFSGFSHEFPMRSENHRRRAVQEQDAASCPSACFVPTFGSIFLSHGVTRTRKGESSQVGVLDRSRHVSCSLLRAKAVVRRRHYM
ncbi:hypothetical protein ABZP36_007325 [Zizania latifolia]